MIYSFKDTKIGSYNPCEWCERKACDKPTFRDMIPYEVGGAHVAIDGHGDFTIQEALNMEGMHTAFPWPPKCDWEKLWDRHSTPRAVDSQGVRYMDCLPVKTRRKDEGEEK